MKTQLYRLMLGALFALSTASAAPAAKTELLKRFTTADKPISKEVMLGDDKAWQASPEKPVTLRLFEVADPNVENCMLTYRAKLKTEGLTAPAYLEMWCRVPGRGEFFSRGLQNTVTGSNDWASYETPFFLKKGEQPDLIKLNVVLKGAGRIWIKEVELIKSPLPKTQ